MALKKYTLTRVLGEGGICWHCQNKGHFILDDSSNEIFVCASCVKENYRNSRLLKKLARLQRTIKNQKTLHVKHRTSDKISREVEKNGS